MKHLFVRPLDVWLFRNGKPFNAGTDHRAETVFPPLPTVLQGAIRTHYIEQHGGIPAYLNGEYLNGDDVANKVGKKGEPPPETFQLQGGFLAHYKQDNLICYVPLPAQAYLDGETYRLLEPKQEPSVISDLGEGPYLLWRDENVKPTKGEGGGWLSLANLQTLLQDRVLCQAAVKSDSDFFERESRLGIQLDYQTRSTETGKLYQAEFVRLQEGFGLYIGLKGLEDWPDNGIMNIGGESHAAIYESVSEPTIPEISAGKNGFTLTFLTPTYFAKGWQPVDWSRFVGDSAKFVAAAVNKPLILGGFDLANKRHRASRRYVPAGSTYYFEGAANITLSTICDEVTENEQRFNYGRYGFGQYILGAW